MIVVSKIDPLQPLRFPVRHHSEDPGKLVGSQDGVREIYLLQARHEGCDQQLSGDRAQIVVREVESCQSVMLRD